MLAVSNADLEATVLVLETKVEALQALVNGLMTPPVVTPLAPLPSDVYLGGTRHTFEGVMYTTNVVAGTDRFIGGHRLSNDGARVITP